ncbi:MAG: hypothetical protein LBK63_06070 [Treponema sp.]|jgi:hypothetical protein|nr:hypothetical protein [Treponema sp.]
MYSSDPETYEAIPQEYRKIAEDLFPLVPDSGAEGPTVKAAENFAEILGIGADYKRLLDTRQPGKDLERFLGHFQNNLDLLIQKTWVDKTDEARKEKLQDRIPGFIVEIEREDYRKALKEFSAILGELLNLFFGCQSNKDDFGEYAFRIDVQVGLLWWYGRQIGRFKPLSIGSNESQGNGAVKAAANDPCKEGLWAVLLLGICYLTNF